MGIRPAAQPGESHEPQHIHLHHIHLHHIRLHHIDPQHSWRADTCQTLLGLATE